MTEIQYAQSASDDAVQQVMVDVPSDYIAQIGGVTGFTLGEAKAEFVAADQGSTAVPMSGTIQVADPTTQITFGGATVTMAQEASACTGVASHSTLVIANLAGGGLQIQVPIFVDLLTLGNPLSDSVTYTIVACFASPNVAAGTAGRAPAGTKLKSLSLGFHQFSVPPGWFVWHALATPFAAGASQANRAGAIEAQSVDRTPHLLTLKTKSVKVKVKAKAKLEARVSGVLTAGGKGVVGASVRIVAGAKTVATVVTKSGGGYSVLFAKKPSGKLVASTSVSAHVLPACFSTIFNVACSQATYGAFAVDSSQAN